MSPSDWSDLLARVRADIPVLLTEFLAELAASPGYERGPVPADDLERTALQAFDVFLARLAAPEGRSTGSEIHPADPADPADPAPGFPESLGRRRARQGVPLPVLSEGVRINFRLLWRALHRAAEPDLIDVLARNGERIITVVEGYATEVQAAYLDEAQIMAQFHRTARERALAELFSGTAGEPERAVAAETLGLPVDGEFELLAVPRTDLPDAVASARGSAGVFSYEDGDLLFVFRQRRGEADWAIARLPIHAAYISRVYGVGALAHASRLARRLCEAEVRTGVATLRSAFPALLGEELGRLVAGFEGEVLGRWRSTDPGERARLRETVDAFLRSGSVKEAGEELFLHRNTVFKRLRSFEDVTGLDVTIPRDATIALVLLSAPGADGDDAAGPPPSSGASAHF
ncbi:helix-turn-helix domain-containing protein [Leucobacter sp. CSA2]|uniref:Helix-turn-helix domain-containing protein n=1 Tax=Leucobacter edaphi TaxID=2796472 RepID=A0A934QBX1_9MICO|nr:PucR family transcriptional regulator [Leucobacter edaphi]MBK0421830.1 helix-turn-helix domain-containing protein [Leucobacter edaphi]